VIDSGLEASTVSSSRPSIRTGAGGPPEDGCVPFWHAQYKTNQKREQGSSPPLPSLPNLCRLGSDIPSENCLFRVAEVVLLLDVASTTGAVNSFPTPSRDPQKKTEVYGLAILANVMDAQLGARMVVRPFWQVHQTLQAARSGSCMTVGELVVC
jgi:hypothetical protein